LDEEIAALRCGRNRIINSCLLEKTEQLRLFHTLKS
jgi:hypothetical protein